MRKELQYLNNLSRDTQLMDGKIEIQIQHYMVCGFHTTNNSPALGHQLGPLQFNYNTRHLELEQSHSLRAESHTLEVSLQGEGP